MFHWRVGLLILCPLITHQLSLLSTSSSYIGAVVEYTPVTKTEDGRDLGDINADNYIKFIKKAKEYSVDILVFPESSLSISSSTNKTIARSEAASYIPDPNDNVIPCNDNQLNNLTKKYASSLEKLSCAARLYRMYVVINHREKVDCKANTEGCSSDGYLIYNTHLTFDRNGRIISKYRKYNLFGEYLINVTAKPEISTFFTDFGVRFGQFICFDILFESPAVNLTRDLGITDIVYSSHWYNVLPYGFGNEAQAAWAYASDTNFLASGYNDRLTGSGGSGIFIGRKGQLHVVTTDLPSNILIVAEIPKKIDGKRLLNIDREKLRIYEFNQSEISTSHEINEKSTGNYTYQTTNLTEHNSELIKLENNNYTRVLCHNDFCCDFNLTISFNNSVIDTDVVFYRYRLIAYNSTLSFAGRGSGKTKICGIVACLNNSLDSCGKLIDSNKKIVWPTLLSINVRMPIDENKNTKFLPVSPFTLKRSGKRAPPLPLNVTEFILEGKGKNGYVMELNEPRSDLLTFVLIGRNFYNGSAGMTISSAITLINLIFFCRFFV